MSDNPWDGANVRSYNFRCYARLERARGNPEHFTLTLAVSDGPETFANFDPAERVNSDGECSLTEAITTAVNRLLQAAQEDEAGRWIDDHQEVYVVVGRTGQGPDAQSWNVKAFASEERANGVCYRMNDWCYGVGLDPAGAKVKTMIDPRGDVVRHPEDPHFRVDGGTEYEVVKIQLDMFDPIRE